MKNLLSIIILFLACTVLVSGITLSYFSDKAVVNATHFTTGNVKVDIELEEGDWENWKPENDKTITWYFTNTGTLDANLEVEIDDAWDTSSVKFSVSNSAYDEYPNEPTVSWKQEGSDWDLEDDIYIYKATVAPNEKVPLTFNLSIDDITSAYEGAKYKITLKVTATQVIDE